MKPGGEQEVFVFGPYRLDPSKRLLTRGGERLPTPLKVFDALLLLVENRDRVVAKEEIVTRLWPDVTVTDASLKQVVASVRRLLDGDGQEHIETFPKVGYRFLAPVQLVSEALPEAHLEPAAVDRTRRPSRRALFLSIALAALLAAAAVPEVAGRRLSYAPPPEMSAEIRRERPAVRALIQRGRHHWLERSGDGLFKSMLAFRQASELDPRSGAAWAGLADSCAFDAARWQESEALARKALQLSPRLAGPWGTLGFVSMAWRWDLVTAGGHLKKAVDADPRDGTLRQWHALFLTLKGHLPEAQLELEEAAQLHPTSLPLLCDLARTLYFRGQVAEARQRLAEMADLDPTFLPAKQLRLEMAIAARDLDEAVTVFLTLPSLEEEGLLEASRREARELGAARFLERHLAQRYDHPFYPDGAGILVAVGKPEKALPWLEDALSRRAFLLPAARQDPLFAALRPEPRFQAFLARLAEAVRSVPEEAP